MKILIFSSCDKIVFKTICRPYPANIISVYSFCFRWKDWSVFRKICKDWVKWRKKEERGNTEFPHAFLYRLNCSLEKSLPYVFASHLGITLPRSLESYLFIFIALVLLSYCQILWKVRKDQPCLHWCYYGSYITIP